MDRDKQVEVHMVLGYGGLSFCLNGVLLNIRFQGANCGQTVPHLEIRAVGPEDGGKAHPLSGAVGDATRLAEEVARYRQISQEIYEGLGRLAKQINLSIQDLSLAEIIQSSTASPGERLEQVRSQVTDVLEMTEKATLNILNLVEGIQEDCRKVQGHLLSLANGNGMAKETDRQEAGSGEGSDAREFWSRFLSQGENLDRLIRTHFRHVSTHADADPRIRLTDVLQVLLEFCNSEKVKPHLKTLQEQHEALFRVKEAELALARLARETPTEDGFCQLPVYRTLTILQETSTEARVKELLGKLSASAAKIFQVAAFSLECPLLESDPEGEPGTEVLALWQEFFEALRQATRISPCGQPGTAEDERLQEAAREALDTVKRIHESLSRITEALAFQDLSGQRLLKVLAILRQLQVQVLTLLVAAGDKLRLSLEGKEMSFTESEISAQQQLNRLLNNLTPELQEPAGPDPAVSPPEPLDQEAINELLTSMGF